MIGSGEHKTDSSLSTSTFFNATSTSSTEPSLIDLNAQPSQSREHAKPPVIETIDDIQKLHGHTEDDFVEAKVEIISQAEITKKIHSFLNGDQKKGYILLGVAEDKNEIVTNPPPKGLSLGIDFSEPLFSGKFKVPQATKDQTAELIANTDAGKHLFDFMRDNDVSESRKRRKYEAYS